MFRVEQDANKTDISLSYEPVRFFYVSSYVHETVEQKLYVAQLSQLNATKNAVQVLGKKIEKNQYRVHQLANYLLLSTLSKDADDRLLSFFSKAGARYSLVSDEAAADQFRKEFHEGRFRYSVTRSFNWLPLFFGTRELVKKPDVSEAKAPYRFSGRTFLQLDIGEVVRICNGEEGQQSSTLGSKQ